MEIIKQYLPMGKIKQYLPVMKKYTPAYWGLVLMCFLMPFVSFSCQGERIATLNGFQVAFGSSVSTFDGTRRIPGEFLAVGVFLVAIVGLLVSRAKRQNAEKHHNILCALGLILLLALRHKIDESVLRDAGRTIWVDYKFGYWLLLILLVYMNSITIFSYLVEKEQKVAEK